MPKKKPYRASLDQIKITRKGKYAIIKYKDSTIAITHLKIGPDVKKMTDREILDIHNEIILAQENVANKYEYTAIEIPPGRPQIKYSRSCNQWVSRGDVLRCFVSDGGPDGEATICIDDHELSLQEFGRLLCVYAGWGMRISFVPENELNNEPDIEIREPPEDEQPILH